MVCIYMKDDDLATRILLSKYIDCQASPSIAKAPSLGNRNKTVRFSNSPRAFCVAARSIKRVLTPPIRTLCAIYIRTFCLIVALFSPAGIKLTASILIKSEDST